MRKSVAHRLSQTDLHRAEPETGSLAAQRWLLLAIALGTTLAPLNSTMIAVALPNIQDDLDVSVAQTAWLVTLYLVAMAVGQPIGGRIGDLFGRRGVYLAGLVWFAIASAACAFAPSLDVLIVFRTQQALAGALTFPNGAAIIREAVPPERRGSAFGVVGMTTALAAAIGPPLGGVLVHAFDWRAIFWANVPIIAVALLLNHRHLPVRKQRDQQRPPFDWAGSLLFAITLGAFIGIPTMVRSDRYPAALAAVFLSVGAGVLFVLWELRGTYPVVDVRLFVQQTFAAACASIALSNLVMYTTLLALPLYMDHVRGDDEQVIGLTLMALSAVAAFWGLLGGRITDSRGKWLPSVAGAAALFAGMVMLAATVTGEDLWPLVVTLAVMGVGLGVQGAPVQTAAVEAAPVAKAGSAAGIYSTSRYIGSVVGATILAIVFATDPKPGDSETFQLLFAGLAVAALAGILVNSRIAAR
jgi:EmrB/QacA subfamily drug resistance transporter